MNNIDIGQFCYNLTMKKSPIEMKEFYNQTIYIKRDDLLSKEFSGNKARKFHYFLENEFPNVKRVISYGSSQSNAMYSISVLAKLRGWRFDYYVKHLSTYLQSNPHGNYRYALKNGMQIHIGQPPSTITDEELFIEEGGRQKEAEYGVKILAKEILEWKEEQGFKELNIFLPSGTGTTAIFLQKAFCQFELGFRGREVSSLAETKPMSPKCNVYTVPCVGDSKYLKKQFLMLEANEDLHPTILVPTKKRHFGKLYRDSYKIWLELQDKMGIEFDLLYDPQGWITLLENPQIFEKPTLYIHQGGLIGNESMLARYIRKYGEYI